MSYAIYVGKDLTKDRHAWIAGYGDEPSSHWLEVVPRADHPLGSTLTVGVTKDADLPGHLTDIPQADRTHRHICVNYTYYKGVQGPLTNGGLNEYGVAVRDVWSPSRQELIDLTPKDQTGPNYSDLARIAVSRARTAREAVEIVASHIAQHGESSYGGNSHIFADSKDAWVMIQFAGGKGLWVAERLGPTSIRASRPGYINEVPINEPNNPNFLYSGNFVSFAQEQGWYKTGKFDANKIYGDGKGRWEGVTWIEQELRSRAERSERIQFDDIAWAIRTPYLTGDTAGYGQIVPLIDSSYSHTRVLWHAPVGAVSAPFSPVFIGQDQVPYEFQKHRYLTEREERTFMDNRPLTNGEPERLSTVSQTSEAYSSAVFECKRLLYLMLQDPGRYASEVHEVFVERERQIFGAVLNIRKSAEVLLSHGEIDLAQDLLTYFSCTELLKGLQLVKDLNSSIEARVRLYAGNANASKAGFTSFEQIW